jgi:hypothetical protein
LKIVSNLMDQNEDDQTYGIKMKTTSNFKSQKCNLVFYIYIYILCTKVHYKLIIFRQITLIPSRYDEITLVISNFQEMVLYLQIIKIIDLMHFLNYFGDEVSISLIILGECVYYFNHLGVECYFLKIGYNKCNFTISRGFDYNSPFIFILKILTLVFTSIVI